MGDVFKWLKLVIPLGLMVAIVFGLQSCAGNITGDLTKIAEVNSPMAQAQGNTAKLMGEVQAQAESDRQKILASGKAKLELDRAKDLQEQTLKEQASQQEANHQKALGEIQASTAASLASINAEAQARLAQIERDRLMTIASVGIQMLVVLGVVILVVILFLGMGRMLFAQARRMESAAQYPLLIKPDPRTMLMPGFVALLPDGQRSWVNPNTGEVLLLSQPSKAEQARLRYLSAQSSVVVQANNHLGRHEMILPQFEEGDHA